MMLPSGTHWLLCCHCLRQFSSQDIVGVLVLMDVPVMLQDEASCDRSMSGPLEFFYINTIDHQGMHVAQH